MATEQATGNPWSERAADWADVLEGWNGWGVPIYRHLAEKLGIGEGTDLLDVGCGAGRFCRLAADRGASVSGLDATEELLEIARERVLEGEFRPGSMNELPWPDDSFDVVTGFNSFFLADDMVAALREAVRVARPGGLIATTVFGRPEESDSPAYFKVMGELAPPPPERDEGDAAPEPPRLHEPGRIEGIAEEAGLKPVESDYFVLVERFRDIETIVRGVSAAPPGRRAAQAVGEGRLRRELGEALAPFVGDDGQVRLREEFRYLIAEA